MKIFIFFTLHFLKKIVLFFMFFRIKIKPNQEKKMDEKKLVEETIFYARKEKQYTLLVLKNLQKIEASKIHLEYNCQTLFAFCVKILEYGESEATIRINTMRLIKKHQLVEKKIAEGELTLSSASLIQSFFKENEISSKEQLQTIEELSGKSARETKERLAQMKDSNTEKDPQYKITLVVDEKTYKKLQQISLEMGEYDRAKILSTLCNEHDEFNDLKNALESKKIKQPLSTEPTTNLTPSRYISTTVKRAVRLRARGQCEFHSKITGERCSMKDHLEFDHCNPFSCGGENSTDNISLHCKQHNLRAAIKSFGVEKMSHYLL